MRATSSLCALLLILAAQAQPPQFRGGVDVVRFDVVVLDKARHPIVGLIASDFRVTENGQPLRTAGFEALTIPDGPGTVTTSPAARSVPDPHVDVVTNHRDGPGRLVVIVMDVSIPYEQGVVTARRIANAAIDALGPNDLGAVVFDGGIAGPRQQGFTADRDRLRAAVASLQMGTPTEVAMTGSGLRRGGPNVPSGACHCGRCAMEKLALVADALSSVQDYRKMILFIGADLPISEDSAAARDQGCAGLFGDARDHLVPGPETDRVWTSRWQHGWRLGRARTCSWQSSMNLRSRSDPKRRPSISRRATALTRNGRCTSIRSPDVTKSVQQCVSRIAWERLSATSR